MELLLDPNAWIAFAMLAALDVVLGIDKIIFILIFVGQLSPHMRGTKPMLYFSKQRGKNYF